MYIYINITLIKFSLLLSLLVLCNYYYYYYYCRVTHVKSQSNQGKSTATIFREQENEKRKYNQRVMDVEMATFTPLVFGTNRGMGVDCQNFLRNLAEKISRKNNESYASVITWLCIQLSFAIVRTAQKCVRGTRIPLNLEKSQRTAPWPLMWQGYFIINFKFLPYY